MTAETFPFLAAIVLSLVGPLLVKRAQRQIAGWMAEMRPPYKVDTKTIPAYLAPEQIRAYVEYATDIVQIVPAITLTAVGVVVALPGTLSPVATAAWMLGVVLLIVVADSVALSLPPHQYLRRKVLGISLVPGVVVVVNLAGLLVVLLAPS